MKFPIVVTLLVACAHNPPKRQHDELGPHLGDSSASSGFDPSRPAPVTPDDPSVISVSATITPQQLRQATAQPQPTPTTATPSTTARPDQPGVFSPPPAPAPPAP